MTRRISPYVPLMIALVFALLGASVVAALKRQGDMLSLVFPFATLIVCGLDVRWSWSPEVGLPVHLAGLALMVLGFAIISWAMVSNPFFSGAVRIQSERGHTVASGGPYRYVRHPGYVGMILHFGSLALVLGSLWALLPALINVALFILRTALEDRTLQAELPGYREYAAQTRYRLLPGVW